MLNDDLKTHYNKAREIAFKAVQKRFPNEIPTSVNAELKKRFKLIMKNISHQNEKEAYNVCNAFVNREFLSI